MACAQTFRACGFDSHPPRVGIARQTEKGTQMDCREELDSLIEGWSQLHGYHLEQPSMAALEQLVELIEILPELGRPAMVFNPAERVSVTLHEGAFISAYMLTWMPGQRAAWHDHEGAVAAYLVHRGALVDHHYREPHLIRTYLRKGMTKRMDKSYMHAVDQMGNEPAVSFHAYSAPTGGLCGMRKYQEDSNHNLVLVEGPPVVSEVWVNEERISRRREDGKNLRAGSTVF